MNAQPSKKGGKGLKRSRTKDPSREKGWGGGGGGGGGVGGCCRLEEKEVR